MSVCDNSVFSIFFLITWPTELKLCRIILDIGTHSGSVSDFAISSRGARFLESSISISYLITWPPELKLYRMLLDMSAHSRSVFDFAISSQGALWGRLLESSISISSLITWPPELKLKKLFFDFFPGSPRCLWVWPLWEI